MFEGYIEKILQRKLGMYIDGIDKTNFKVGVSAGVSPGICIDPGRQCTAGESKAAEGHLSASGTSVQAKVQQDQKVTREGALYQTVQSAGRAATRIAHHSDISSGKE